MPSTPQSDRDQGVGGGENTEAGQGQHLLLPHSHLQACGCAGSPLPTLPRLLSYPPYSESTLALSFFVHLLKVCCVPTTGDSALNKISPCYLGSSSQGYRKKKKTPNRLTALSNHRGRMGCKRIGGGTQPAGEQQ